MSYTIGLDFGTHQTKVCIEDSSNPAQKIYEFFEFNMPDGNKTVLLPSVVQINKDDTVSYGFVDESECKTEGNVPSKPVITMPEAPKLQNLPLKPIPKSYPERIIKKKSLKGLTFAEQLEYAIKFQNSDSISDSEYCAVCDEIDVFNKKQLIQWESMCETIKTSNNKVQKEYQDQCALITAKHTVDILNWEKDIQRRRLIFRYFKLASFYNVGWDRTIKPEILSVWYIANLIFLLEEKYGTDILIQMGIPSTMTTESTEEAKSGLAIRIFIAARNLVKYYINHSLFLRASYKELLKLSELPTSYSIDDKWAYGIETMPEAFAGLYAIIHQGRISNGMSLLVDIGGGTTDLAFFSKTNNTPDIHYIVSYPRGMNFILEQLRNSQNLPISDIIKLFSKGNDPFLKKAQSYYHSDLKKLTEKKIVEKVKSEFRKTSNFPIEALEKALVDRPVVYCGGGSTFSSMRRNLSSFTDVSVINKSLLSIPYLKNKNIPNELFTILSTSYGLSIPIQEAELKMTPLFKLFEHIQMENEHSYEDKPDYGTDDY